MTRLFLSLSSAGHKVHKCVVGHAFRALRCAQILRPGRWVMRRTLAADAAASRRWQTIVTLLALMPVVVTHVVVMPFDIIQKR